ncbi:MAG TPA: hypothetical protein VM733_00020 [Thermoanaerobaculia bacterium]|nr:hypothetical protein [Thermoanaerobaculia bacterium]
MILALVLAGFLSQPKEILGTSIASVTRRLGPPEQTSFVLIASPHDPKMRNVRATLTYRGATITVLNVLCCDQSLLERVRVTDPRVIAFPETAKAVRERFGEPSQARGGRLVYRIENDVGIDTITFEVNGGRVRAVEWQYFVD